VPLKSDSAHVTQLTSLQFRSVKSTLADFTVEGADLQFQVEASAPGVYRLRCAPAGRLHDEKRGVRDKARAEMLVARPEPVGEMSMCSLTSQRGWRLEQGDTALEITQSPLRLALHRGEHCVLRMDLSAGPAARAEGAPAWGLAIAPR